MALSTNELALHMGLISSGETLDATLNTRLTLIRQSAESEINEYIGSSIVPVATVNMATVRMASYLWDESPSRQNKNLNPLRASGAMALLFRHREISLGDAVALTNEELLAEGFTQAEVDALRQLLTDAHTHLRTE